MYSMKHLKYAAFACLFMLLLLAGCGKHVKTATTYYTLVNRAPNYDFFRLEADGNFVSGRGLKGSYELKKGVVTFSENEGGKTEGYIEGNYLFYFAYDKGTEKIPDGERFNVKISDTHSNFTFSEDGSFTEIVKYSDPTSANAWKGTYVRSGNILTLTMTMQDNTEVVRVYGIRDGLMYNAYSCDESLFDADAIATVEEAEKKAAEKETGILGVVLIVVIMLIVLALIFFIIIFSQKKKQRDMEDSTKK